MAAQVLDLEPEVEAAAALEPRPWPKDLKDQLAVLRAVVTAAPTLWTLEQIPQAFKSRGRFRESLASHLDLLTDLGMIARVDTTDGPRWHRPQAVGAWRGPIAFQISAWPLLERGTPVQRDSDLVHG